VQTVCETEPYLREAKACGLSTDQLSRIVELLADDPMRGTEIVGSGGFRKFRVAGRGKGKSGGYRVVSFYSGEHVPVFLITIFSKGEKSNLSDAEVRNLRRLGKEIVAAYMRRVVPWRSRR
jgi:hypothetical protein